MESKPKEKVMSYEEKSVGSTPFFKCEACPYMALAEDDIKFHLFTVHPDLAKSNGLADNIQIHCPGCTNVFDAEETLRTHLRNHHKMGIKDVKKMIKSLVQIALKNAKLRKEAPQSVPPTRQDIADVRIPQVIEIVPDISNTNSEQLPKGVAFISVDELNKMSAPNFETIDPKEVIQEASINIVYTNDISTQYVNVSKSNISNSPCNVIQVSSVTPDLISSIQPRVNMSESLSPSKKDEQTQITDETMPYKYKGRTVTMNPEENGTLCSVNKCYIRLKDPNNLSYHKKCHQNGKLQCPECGKVFLTVDQCHTHLWKIHDIDVELPTCVVCGYKTFQRHRLLNIHMKCHEKLKGHTCSLCSKSFKNMNQLTKHRQLHKADNTYECHICKRQFHSQPRLKSHIAAVHDKLKPFKCCHCDYTAARKEELKLHLRSHTGDKPYGCDQCSYRSADHNSMRRHKKVHSKDAVYKCKYCPYSSIQSSVFTSHMISKHPNITSNDIHYCSYCSFKSINEEKYLMHLTTHRDKEDIQMLCNVELTKTKNKPSWTIPTDGSEKIDKEDVDKDISIDKNKESSPKTVNEIPIEVFDCDSLPETLPQEYPKNYCTTSSNSDQSSNFNSQDMVTDLSKDDNNSDCLLSESSNDTMLDRHQYNPQHSLQITYDTTQSNLHYLNTSATMEQTLLQTANVDTLTTSHSPIVKSISNNIMANFPIRLPPAPISMRNNITLKPVDKLSLPMSKVTGPIIKPTQILPVPSSSHSPINITHDNDGVPRKKAKISVKSNLILKGPDQVNMFHSQQKMAFKQLEDNERYGLGGPVTFNNLITTQFMQLPPEPVLSESPNTIMTYAQENMLGESATTPVDSEMTDDPQIFSFNQQMNVSSMTMLPPPQKIQTNDPSYIKLEATIKQNTQSPSLERMCNANLLNNQALSREYKASPPLEDIHKNMSEIKNEVKSDAFYTIPLTNSTSNPPLIDQYLIDNIIPEQYPGHMDLSTVVMPELSDHQNDVIEIDDNSDDNKLLPRFDMNFPLESLYLMQNDFHFLENDIQMNNSSEIVNEMNRMVAEVPIINQKENLDMTSNELSSDFPNYIQGKKDPMMNTSVRPTNKINVKNIELMKN
ncbi:uncharacterized protein LOC123694911 [Colias croceus]|uniref:uncharacterized protein LOC123694911 n=1 Tax=Colias crocea TaxID=72248 RepID=UPI001E281452|nr:uncharacterized protein LOC123694911 [Colias croceus]